MGWIIVYTTFPKRRKAVSVAKHLLKEKLVGCANIFKIDSLYSWKGEVQEDGEYGVFLKTQEELYERLEARLKELHPYEVPTILMWRIEKGWEGYLDWLKKVTTP